MKNTVYLDVFICNLCCFLFSQSHIPNLEDVYGGGRAAKLLYLNYKKAMHKKENKYLNHVLWPQDFCEQDKVYQIAR